jgi:hypothetical protein
MVILSLRKSLIPSRLKTSDLETYYTLLVIAVIPNHPVPSLGRYSGNQKLPVICGKIGENILNQRSANPSIQILTLDGTNTIQLASDHPLPTFIQLTVSKIHN